MELEKVNTESQSVALEAQTVKHIATVAEYEAAGELVKRGQLALKMLDEAYDSIRKGEYHGRRQIYKR